MIKKIFNGNYLFVKQGCPYCKIAKKSVNKINYLLPLTEKIIIVDCTYADMYGIITDSRIKEYYDYLNAYPTLFIGNIRKEGANSVIEYTAWLKVKLRKKFIVEEGNEYLPNIDQYAMHDLHCKRSRGRVICN